MKRLANEFVVLVQGWTLRHLWKTARHDDILGVAAEVSFYGLFALFPFLLFVGAVISIVVHEPAAALAQMIGLLHRLLPATTATILGKFLKGAMGPERPYLLSLGIIGILWAGSQGFAAVLKAMSRIYCVYESRSWIRERAYSFGIMFRVVVASVAVLLVMTGPDPGGILSPWVARPELVLPWHWIRWPALLVILGIVLGWFYTSLPCVGHNRRWLTAGGLTASGLWLLASSILSTYMDRSSSYARIYGPVGDVVVLMLWIYVGAFVMLLGAEIDVAILRGRQRLSLLRARPAPRGTQRAAASGPASAPAHVR